MVVDLLLRFSTRGYENFQSSNRARKSERTGAASYREHLILSSADKYDIYTYTRDCYTGEGHLVVNLTCMWRIIHPTNTSGGRDV